MRGLARLRLARNATLSQSIPSRVVPTSKRRYAARVCARRTPCSGLRAAHGETKKPKTPCSARRNQKAKTLPSAHDVCAPSTRGARSSRRRTATASSSSACTSMRSRPTHPPSTLGAPWSPDPAAAAGSTKYITSASWPKATHVRLGDPAGPRPQEHLVGQLRPPLPGHVRPDRRKRRHQMLLPAACGVHVPGGGRRDRRQRVQGAGRCGGNRQERQASRARPHVRVRLFGVREGLPLGEEPQAARRGDRRRLRGLHAYMPTSLCRGNAPPPSPWSARGRTKAATSPRRPTSRRASTSTMRRST